MSGIDFKVVKYNIQLDNSMKKGQEFTTNDYISNLPITPVRREHFLYTLHYTITNAIKTTQKPIIITFLTRCFQHYFCFVS